MEVKRRLRDKRALRVKAVQVLESRLADLERNLAETTGSLVDYRKRLDRCGRLLHERTEERDASRTEFADYKAAELAGAESRNQLYQGFLAQNEEMKRLAGFLRTCYPVEAAMGHHDGLSVTDIVIRYLRIERNVPGWIKWLCQPRPVREWKDPSNEDPESD